MVKPKNAPMTGAERNRRYLAKKRGNQKVIRLKRQNESKQKQRSKKVDGTEKNDDEM